MLTDRASFEAAMSEYLSLDPGCDRARAIADEVHDARDRFDRELATARGWKVSFSNFVLPGRRPLSAADRSVVGARFARFVQEPASGYGRAYPAAILAHSDCAERDVHEALARRRECRVEFLEWSWYSAPLAALYVIPPARGRDLDDRLVLEFVRTYGPVAPSDVRVVPWPRLSRALERLSHAGLIAKTSSGLWRAAPPAASFEVPPDPAIGPDSTPVAFRLSPGERVDFAPPCSHPAIVRRSGRCAICG